VKENRVTSYMLYESREFGGTYTKLGSKEEHVLLNFLLI
jgi:hypothetical protein